MSHSKFTLGLGLGTLIGGALVCWSRTPSGRKMKDELCCAMHKLSTGAHEMLHQVKDEAKTKENNLPEEWHNMLKR